ncbi:MAG: N-acetylmuramoyl-L-alanine amidase [Clostridia bacterium]|nr:N-acetylmuramoyl-L-alanine amidase [Clostridia bacterium]
MFVSLPNTVATVVLDAGHGGRDVGVVGVNSNVSEAEINLLITQTLKSKLEDLNVKVVLTRKNADGLYDENATNFKRSDMEKRKKIILDTAPNLVVSIHCNRFPSSERRGAQVFFNNFSDEGKKLASLVQKNLNTINIDKINRGFSPLKGDYYILNCSKYPSCIVECGFLSNPDDDMLLNDENYRNMLADAILSGIMSYLSSS